MVKCVGRVLLAALVCFISPTFTSPLLGQAQTSNSQTLSPSLVQLEVVAILPSPSKKALALSRLLFRTLNSVTSADLVAQLDFPEKNVTWVVRNFFVSEASGGSSSSSITKQERLIQHQIFDYEEDSEMDEDDEEDEDGTLGDDGRGGVGIIGDKKGRHKMAFNPKSVSQLCDLLSGHKVLALVSLLPDYEHNRLLSLVSSAVHLPLLAHSTVATLRDEEDLFVNLSTYTRDLAKAVKQLLLQCHWHSFTALLDDSPRIRATHGIWEKELNSEVKLRNQTNVSSEDYYATNMDYPIGEDDNSNWLRLRPTMMIIQNRFPHSAFRALSEISKATQGIILLILSERSTKAVFEAARQLRMLNGDYIFVMVDPRSQFATIPDWIPQGVLAVESPRVPWMDKRKMRYTGTILASAISSIKDQAFFGQRGHGGARSRQMAGGVFSGFSNRDFEVEGQLDFNEDDAKTPEVADPLTYLEVMEKLPNLSCFQIDQSPRKLVSADIASEIRKLMRQPEEIMSPEDQMPQTPKTYFLLNLIRPPTSGSLPQWSKVGVIPSEGRVSLNTIRWPGRGIFGSGGDERPSKSYRVVTIVAPPFVMESKPEDNQTCVVGLPCLKLKNNILNKDNLAVLFAEFESRSGSLEYELACCDGLAMDLLTSVARELKFEIDLFVVPDGFYGSKNPDGGWNGMMGALISGAASLCFAPISILSIRATAVDFSTPFFFSGVGLLGISKERDVPLFAFLAPFSPTLWAAIFITLNLTALVVAIYEWFSPFGLNPWGRQRTKNFSISSALWVVWGRLFSHLVAFKAPKSWPNKFLINVWGGFSVIFVASYTANIAALFAGMFFERHVDVNDRSLLSQRVTAIKHSATDFYIKRENPHLWEHIQRFPVHSFQEGVRMLKNGSLDLLIGDGPLLDYYRGTDSSCNLIDVSDHDKIGDDSYAVAMTRGFPLRDSVSGLISKYLGNGYLDYLQGKWFGQMPCFLKNQQAGARALGVDAVVGMLIMLGVAMMLGIVILILELLIFKHALPYWRSQPKGTLWRSPNLMFFSQKLYRFINCVELVSPHHAAKELAKTLRHGQITSLFQKSVKRKEHEQKRRRKSEAQFFKMIQEIKRVQMAEKQGTSSTAAAGSSTSEGVVRRRTGAGDQEVESSSTVYSIQGQGRMDTREMYHPARMTRVPGGEEILIADYPQGNTSFDDSSLSVSMQTEASQRKIQWRHPRPGYPYMPQSPSQRPSQPHGILRRSGAQMVEVESIATPSPQTTSRGTSARGRGRDRDAESDEDEEGDGDGDLSEDDRDSCDFYSPLDKADLKSLSKNQIIEMWRVSELDLRRQLSQALKAKDELSVALSRTDTPAMLVEFDQVKL